MEDDGAANDAQFQAEVAQRGAEVDGMLRRKEKAKALAKALENPPVTAKSGEVKEANAKIVESCLGQIGESEMGAVIDSLNAEACDTLMKYSYYFMEKNFNCGSMLKLHALLADKAGMGCIIRTLTDRKTVWA